MEYQPGMPNTGKDRATNINSSESASKNKAGQETKGKLLGLHDYMSNVRVLGFEVRIGGAEGLFAYVKKHAIETLDKYFERVGSSNQNLKEKLDQDVAAYPETVNNFRSVINDVNNARTPEEMFQAYQHLKNFFEI